MRLIIGYSCSQYLCARIYTPTHAHSYTPTHEHTFTPTHAHIYTPTHAHIYIYIYMYTHTHQHIHVHATFALLKLKSDNEVSCRIYASVNATWCNNWNVRKRLLNCLPGTLITCMICGICRFSNLWIFVSKFTESDAQVVQTSTEGEGKRWGRCISIPLTYLCAVVWTLACHLWFLTKSSTTVDSFMHSVELPLTDLKQNHHNPNFQ